MKTMASSDACNRYHYHIKMGTNAFAAYLCQFGDIPVEGEREGDQQGGHNDDEGPAGQHGGGQPCPSCCWIR